MAGVWIAGAVGALIALSWACAGLAALVATLATYAVWVVERRRSGRIAHRASRSDGQRFARVVLFEWLSAWVLYWLTPFGWILRASPGRGRRAGARPLVLVHGYAQNGTNFVLLKRRLAASGFGPIHSVTLAPAFGCPRDLADRLAREIDRVLEAAGAAEADVVAHSMGGLVSRLVLAASRETGERKIRRLITLGTPHKGTHIAYLAPGRGGLAMREGSEVLEQLHAEAPPPGALVAISSEHDNFMVPAESARAGGAGRDVVLRGLGHMSLLFSSEVARLVAEALREPIELEPRAIEGASDAAGRSLAPPLTPAASRPSRGLSSS